MATIGKRNLLRVMRQSEHGLYLDGGSYGEILLPKRYVLPGNTVDSLIDVFIYRDSEDRMVATTEKPYVEVGELASLKVVGGHVRIGAFLDWGLSKDLLLPNRELSRRVGIGESVVVYVFVDKKSDRVVATTRFEGLLNLVPARYSPNQRVGVFVIEETPLGFKAVVEGAHWGLFYHSDLAAPLQIGAKMDAFVRGVRPDGKVDLSLLPAGYGKVAPLAEKILEALKSSGGRLDIGDHSSPAAIQERFGCSKKAFKQAIGALFKELRIAIDDKGIALRPEPKVVRRRH
ncbi:MAG: hypothetical protein RL088_2437 [Verrucomicrobiota bacterium]|jgi:predicted RNA-binding protein (virulence factor B family)